MIKFLIDECVGYSVTQWLLIKGFDVVFVGNFCPGMSDKQVLEKAVTENRVLITCDTDFGELVFRMKMAHSGILLLRLSVQTSESKISLLSNVLDSHLFVLPFSFTVATENLIRVTKIAIH